MKVIYTKFSLPLYISDGGMRCRGWLRRFATTRKVAGSISDGVIGVFQWHNSSDRPLALGSTRPLAFMSAKELCLEEKTAGA